MTGISWNHGQIAYTSHGVGEAVLSIHCSTASGGEWRALCQALAPDYWTIMPDQWGCGKSDPWSGRGAFDLGSEAGPIIAICEEIDHPVHLVGHSYGGAVALRIGRERPDLIKSLTLIEPSAFHLLRGDPRHRWPYREIADVADRVRASVTCGDSWRGMSHFIDYWNGPGSWDSMPMETRLALAQKLGKVVLDFRALFDEPVELWDYAALTMPTLILCGDRSPAPSRRIVDMLYAAMPRAQRRTIEGAGHMSPLTHPDSVNAAIREHIDRYALSPMQSGAASFIGRPPAA